MSQNSIPIVRVSEWEMRRIFNDGRYWERVQSGELVAIRIHEGIPTPDKGLPAGTKTVTIAIRDTADGPDLAHAHAFLKPDGSIGASGLWDPKRILKDGKLYRLIKQKDRQGST